MEKAPESLAEQEGQDNANLANKALKVASYPIAGISGLWATNVVVHNGAYDQAKRLNVFKDIIQKADAINEKDVTARRLGKISLEEYSARWPKTKTVFQNAADARLEEFGINSFMKKWNYMAKSNKPEAIIVGMTVAGIAIGALLTIANSKTFGDLFSGNSKDQQER